MSGSGGSNDCADDPDDPLEAVWVTGDDGIDGSPTYSVQLFYDTSFCYERAQIRWSPDRMMVAFGGRQGATRGVWIADVNYADNDDDPGTQEPVGLSNVRCIYESVESIDGRDSSHDGGKVTFATMPSTTAACWLPDGGGGWDCCDGVSADACVSMGGAPQEPARAAAIRAGYRTERAASPGTRAAATPRGRTSRTVIHATSSSLTSIPWPSRSSPRRTMTNLPRVRPNDDASSSPATRPARLRPRASSPLGDGRIVSKRARITDPASCGGQSRHPDWSPDGTIIFTGAARSGPGSGNATDLSLYKVARRRQRDTVRLTRPKKKRGPVRSTPSAEHRPARRRRRGGRGRGCASLTASPVIQRHRVRHDLTLTGSF